MLGEGTLGYKVMLITYRVLGEGTLVSWFGVFLVMVTRMDVLMCFRADFPWRYQECIFISRF